MVGETVRFARNERHGLRVRDKCVAIPIFLVNSNMNADMRLPCFKATLVGDR
jgi:hypothetical protein